MSENRELSSSAHADAESDIIYTRHLREGPPSVDFTVSSDIKKISSDIKKISSDTKKKLSELKPWKLKKETSKRPVTSLASAEGSAANIINMIDTFDRPEATSVEGTYAGTGAYAYGFEDKPGKRFAKAGAYAEAGVGRARAEWSVFEAEAKGPNASAVAEANVVSAGAIARAELASASATAGPFGVRVGLGVDTGASVSANGLEVKVLGIVFTVGPRTSLSFLGSEVSCCVM